VTDDQVIEVRPSMADRDVVEGVPRWLEFAERAADRLFAEGALAPCPFVRVNPQESGDT